MKFTERLQKPGAWRTLVQWGFLGWTLYLGIQFALFVRHFETEGIAPPYLRPPGVEGFLPIGALVSLRHFIATGEINPVHPAALVIFLTILALSLLARKAFCSWLCPVGTISEGLADLGRKIFGRNPRVWGWLDIPLRGVKYFILLFFAKAILIDMPAAALGGFLSSPYWAVSDVRMLHFFTRMSSTTLLALLVLAVLSMVIRHFWCRYLCPYGALLGIVAWLSPFRIRRDAASCTGCGACTRSCPSRLAIDRKNSVRSPECTGCLTCTEACPVPKTLGMAPPLAKTFPWRGYAVIVLLVFTAGIGTGMATGHWHSSLSYDDFRVLIPLAERMGF